MGQQRTKGNGGKGDRQGKSVKAERKEDVSNMIDEERVFEDKFLDVLDSVLAKKPGKTKDKPEKPS